MSGFVETLVASKVHPLTKAEKEEEEEIRGEQKKASKDGAEIIIRQSKGTKMQEDHHDEDDDDIKLTKTKNSSNWCPLIGPKGQPHKDVKGGKSTPKWKQRVPERLNTSDLGGGRNEARVQIERLSIVCPGRPEIVLSHPFISSPKACLFTLKEGTKYRLKFTFVVSNNVVSGLKYEHTLWKAGIRINRSIVNLGTFSPQEKPHAIELEEETLPSGILIRGLYSARAKVIDDEGTCYMDIHYHFDIQKSWPFNT
ncbi:Rho GDP-dissociation inhibitor 1 [Striga hermonthica]|uniref:Rho GDP-dissociation inhibitor 1 n=1 Tax=Striga hermonthica TaxID=68872 RepID=A0A9N7NLM8_STRHE|nr:Rho GDP-dissociation inhibitor 1 [Striga hermonthica]